MFRFIQTSRTGGVERLVLNRPDVRNALNDEVMAELVSWAAHLEKDIQKDHAVRAVVLSGAGKTFCAGADVEWMARTIRYTHEQNLQDATAMSQMFSALITLPV